MCRSTQPVSWMGAVRRSGVPPGRDNPAVPACLVKRASQRCAAGDDEAAWVKDLTSRFTTDGYRMAGAVTDIATSDAFVRVSSGIPAANSVAK